MIDLIFLSASRFSVVFVSCSYLLQLRLKLADHVFLVNFLEERDLDHFFVDRGVLGDVSVDFALLLLQRSSLGEVIAEVTFDLNERAQLG